MSVGYSDYAEEALAEQDVLFGSTERYDIEVGQFRFVTPIGDSLQVKADYSYDKLSGASPWYVASDADGEPVQVMSGATIEDKREDVGVEIKRYADSMSYGARLGYSTEDDYRARSAAMTIDVESADKLQTYSAAVGYSRDEISASDHELFFGRPEAEDKYSSDMYLGFTQIVDKSSLFQVGWTHQRHRGYLTDPYKLATVELIPQAERRPDQRFSNAVSLTYKKFLENVDSALEVSVRYFRDDWQIKSETLSLGWHQNLSNYWRIVPAVRFYHQSEAYFYDLVFSEMPDKGYFSSDYRLSNYSARSFSLELVYEHFDWQVSMYVEEYRTGDASFFGRGHNDHPGLVDFTLANIALTLAF